MNHGEGCVVGFVVVSLFDGLMVKQDTDLEYDLHV